MKQFAITWASLAVIEYLSIAYVKLEPNPLSWSENVRMCSVVAFAILFVLSCVLLEYYYKFKEEAERESQQLKNQTK